MSKPKPPTCPKCGAECYHYNDKIFLCGSNIIEDAEMETVKCLRRQLEQRTIQLGQAREMLWCAAPVMEWATDLKLNCPCYPSFDWGDHPAVKAATEGK